MFVPHKIVEEKLSKILAEDIGQGDVTASATIPPDMPVDAVIIAKEEGIAAGIEEATILAQYLGLKTKAKVADGQKITKKQVLVEISGDARTILSAERTMLNLVSRMSGIATATNKLTEKMKASNSKAKIAATRKTAPGLLYFDKKAVVIGGGDAHRLHLDDMILIKDNHIAVVGSVEEAIKRAKRTASFTKKIEVEATAVDDAVKAVQAGADIVMLDNFSPNQIKEAHKKLRQAGFTDVVLEASGGITEANFLEYAATPVAIISMGEITHSVKALDVSLEVIKTKR